LTADQDSVFAAAVQALGTNLPRHESGFCPAYEAFELELLAAVTARNIAAIAPRFFRPLSYVSQHARTGTATHAGRTNHLQAADLSAPEAFKARRTFSICTR